MASGRAATPRIRRSKQALLEELGDAYETINHQRATIGRLAMERDAEHALAVSIREQTAHQAAAIGRHLDDLAALAADRDMWRSQYWKLATADAEPLPHLFVVPQEGA